MEITEYHSERVGEPVFEMAGERWQYCNVIENGKIDIGVYRFGTDLAYKYQSFREMFNLA